MPARDIFSGLFYPMNRIWRSRIRKLAWLLLAAGALVAVVSVVYFAVPASSLPTVLGRTNATGVRYRRGTAMAILAALVWILAGVALVQSGKESAGAI